MTRGKTTNWIVGTALLALAILAGTWFLGVTPNLNETRDTKSAAEDALARQDQLRLELTRLQAENERLPEYEAEIAALRVQIPTAADLPAYTRTISDLATAHGVTVISVAPGTSQPFGEVDAASAAAPESPAADVPAEGTETGGSTDEGTDDGAAVDAAEETAESAEGAATGGTPVASPEAVGSALLAVPISITVVGPYAQTAAFLEAIQTQAPRLLLVVGLNTLSLDTAEASGGRPATVPGDVEMTIEGLIYHQPVQNEILLPDEEPTDDLAPLPSTERNPYAPITG